MEVVLFRMVLHHAFRRSVCMLIDHPPGSTTVFNGVVFRTLQDALFAFLLWVHGGATGALQYRLYPLGAKKRRRW